LNDQSVLLELFDFLKQGGEEHIDRRSLLDLSAERLRWPIDDPYVDLSVLCLEKRQYSSKRIFETIGSRDGECLRLRMNRRRDPDGDSRDSEKEHHP
jgi:hypothetical protein